MNQIKDLFLVFGVTFCLLLSDLLFENFDALTIKEYTTLGPSTRPSVCESPFVPQPPLSCLTKEMGESKKEFHNFAI